MRIWIFAVAILTAFSCGKAKSKKETSADISPDGLGLVDSTFRTAQRQLVNEAIDRARVANKVVLIRATGAWCPPCVAWDLFLEKNIGDFKSVLDRYEVLSLDEVFYERNIATDHTPVDTLWYPSYFAFNPNLDQWAIIPIEPDNLTALASFKATLIAFAAGEDLTDRYQRLSKEAFEKQIRLSSNTEFGNDAIDIHQAAAINTALNRSAGETIAFLNVMKNTLDASPKLIEGTTYSHSFTTLHTLRTAVSRGIISGADAWKMVEQDHNSANPPKEDQYSDAMYLLYRSPLFQIRKISGLKAAADACPRHVDALKVIKGTNADRIRLLMLDCAQLATEAGTMTREVAIKLADDSLADAGFMSTAKPTVSIYRLQYSAKSYEEAAKQTDSLRDSAFARRQKAFAKRDEVFTKDDAAIAKARTENADSVAIADLEGAKAANILYYNNLPVLRDRESAAYSELAELLRQGIKHPALSRAKTGAGEL